MANKSSVGIFGGKSQPKIIFFLQTETAPEMSYEISERELFRRLLSEKTAKEVGDAQQNETSNILKGIDLKSTISQVETHKSRNVGHIESENIFVVFQTTSSKENRQYWWSLEESTESVAMQRSQEKSVVINKFKGKIRNQVETIADGLKGKGSIKDFLILLWIHIVIDLKYQSFLSRCESFIPLVMKKITETFYEYPPNYFTYSALSSEEINPQVEEIINFLTKVTKWHPLLCLTYLGDIHQFDRVLGNGFFKTKIDGIYNRLTLLNAAILFCKTGMVKHVLEKKKANARKRDQAGRNALNMAALFTDEEEIIKLLLSFQIKDKLNIKDKSGMTAFHYAVISSNLTVARHLIDHGADFKRLDATDHSPLHLAAHYAKDNQILELLLTEVNIDECDTAGITALHSAAIASNAISARYLIERGADINRVDKRGRTPVHVAAALAKNMDFFNVFLSNEKADLECSDERKLTVLAYAKINQFGLAKEIVSGIEKKINDKRSEYSLAKIAGVQPCTGGEYKQTSIFGNLMENITGGINVMGKYSQKFKSTRNLIGGKYKKKLLFVPDADNEPDVVHEISEPALFRFVLNEETLEEFKGAEVEIPEMLDVLKDIDKQSKITQVEAYRNSMNPEADALKAYHVFIVFKSTSEKDGVYWWSLEKGTEYIFLQRSRNKKNVKHKLHGKERIKVKSIKEDLKGKGTIKDLFAILWANQMIPENYHILNSNCQFLVTFVGEQITEIGYKYKGNFPYSPPPESGRDKKMLELINVLRDCSDWSPLFHIIKMGSTDLVDKIVASGKYDINASCNGFTPLHLAIKSEKPEMVQHLLQPPLNADPTKRDASGRSALLFAASSKYEMNAEIIDLLLAHEKVNVDDVDEDGQTALHLTAYRSNVVAVRKLLERGANPNIYDKRGQSPLHLAVQRSDSNEIIDLLLAHGKVNVDHVDEDGESALHFAADQSDVGAVQKLLEKGANPNIFDKWGRSPLHVAAKESYGNEIMDLLLAHSKVKVDDVDGKGQTALHIAAYYSNVMAVEHLINKGANPNAVDKSGDSPIHVAARQSNGRDGNTIIDLLLEAQKVKGICICDVNDRDKEGRTALHYAAAYSNEITAEHLIKKGANVNCRASVGLTPLHYAALGAKDMDIIDLLLQNINEGDIQQYRNDERLFLFARHNLHGLGNKILDRLVEKGIQPPCSTETDNCTGESDEAIDVNTRRFVDKGADPSIDLTGFDGLDFLIVRVKISLGIYDDINGRDQNGETPLLVAIRANNVNWVRNLLEKGADPTIRDERYGDTPFHVAVENCRDFDILNLLLESGKVDINETTFSSGKTALHIAVTESNTATAEFLLSKGANPNVTDEFGLTPLHLVAWYAKDMEIVELLVNHPDVDVDCLNNMGDRALDRAKYNKDGHGERIANLLKEKGVVERENRLPEGNNESLEKLLRTFSHRQPDEIENFLSDDTIPIEAKIDKILGEYMISEIIDSDVESVRRLLKDGADISSARGEDGMNALHVASKYAKTTDLIDAILETGKFDINGVDNEGRTPLHYAIRGCNEVTNARHLIGKGADPNIADKNGVTPLHLATICEETTELIDIILETGKCNINGVDDDGRTPLHYAIEGYSPVTIKARRLIQMGANPGIADKKGRSPLHVAAKYAYSMDLIDELLLKVKTGAVDVNCVDKKGRTPLTYAQDNKHGLDQSIIDRLKEYGAKE